MKSCKKERERERRLVRWCGDSSTSHDRPKRWTAAAAVVASSANNLLLSAFTGRSCLSSLIYLRSWIDWNRPCWVVPFPFCYFGRPPVSSDPSPTVWWTPPRPGLSQAETFERVDRNACRVVAKKLPWLWLHHLLLNCSATNVCHAEVSNRHTHTNSCWLVEQANNNVLLGCCWRKCRMPPACPAATSCHVVGNEPTNHRPQKKKENTKEMLEGRES